MRKENDGTNETHIFHEATSRATWKDNTCTFLKNTLKILVFAKSLT